ncbi:urease accessory protein UreD [Solihabitans fulvus]|uniref:Urease accessory protein UreD n=1 Tax=Solihabitans fulvus TaxID=1892852 RepID=A0A5B2XIZ9_9PSEU|nr:urease accessory protein UreD [Solihabitans fulvus]KAA2262979.1 urease accessory protein UreD [Solihabitans fulvus]
MRADALLVVERAEDGRSVVRELRSMTPLTLIPHRSAVRSASTAALVHLVSSATAPLGGDELTLTVRVGAGAQLCLRGVAATLALPGYRPGGSRATIRFEAADGATVSYLPEPTVVTARADHSAELVAELAEDARLRLREVLVLGRSGERPGRLVSVLRVRRGGRAVLQQRTVVGDPCLDASLAALAGRRVLATELLVPAEEAGEDPVEAACGEWWSRTPLAAGGTLVTALADDVVTAGRLLALAGMS